MCITRIYCEYANGKSVYRNPPRPVCPRSPIAAAARVRTAGGLAFMAPALGGVVVLGRRVGGFVPANILHFSACLPYHVPDRQNHQGRRGQLLGQHV